MRHSTRPRASRAVALLRALVSCLILVAVTGGLPLLLWQATVTALPAGLEGLTHLFSRQDTVGVLVMVLAVIGWLGWLAFVLSVLVEIPAQLRGRISPRLPGFRLGQRAAATLVGSILVLLPTGTAMASPAHTTAATANSAPAAATATTPTAPAGARTSDHARPGTDNDRTDQAHTSYTVREVRPAESLWSIAERELGDGEQWRAIADANRGRTMADGSTFRADGFLQPGWTLRLPDRKPATENPHGTQPRSVTVAPGQTLSGIAQEQMGDAARYREIFDANRGEPQPGGGHFEDPDRIYAGQHLDLPARPGTDAPDQHQGEAGPPTAPRPTTPPHDEAATPDAPAPPKSEPAPDRSTSPTGPSTSTPTPNPPRPTPSHDGSAAVPPAPRPSATDAAKPSPRTEHTAEADHTASRPAALDVWQLAGIGALLAASLAGGLGLKRILQQRRRRAGETIAMPEEASTLEQALTVAAEPASVQLLDTALRTLRHRLGRDAPLPVLHGARVTGRTVELLTDDPASPAPPFVEGDAGWWTLPEDAELLDADQAREVPAPWPGLVTLGTAPDGDLLLLNLPHTGTVLLEGEEADVRTVIRAIAMEAATCAWSDRTEILTVGLGDELSTLLPQGRVRAVPHLRAATRDLGELLLEHHQSPDDEGAPLPWLLICAAHAGEDEAWELADAAAAARDLPVALVLPAARTAACFPEAEILRADTSSAQPSTALSCDVVLQHVSDEDYHQFVTDLRTAEEPARPAAGPWRNVPAGPPDEEDVSELVGPVQQATPFTSLAASAGPATIHFLPPSPAAEPSSTSGDGDGDEPEGAAGVVVSLIKEETDQPTPAASAPEQPVDPDAPEVQVLGPVAVTGIHTSGHGAKLASLAALVFFKPGRGAEALREAMDPNSPWSKATLQSRMSELRGRLGTNADGELYLPRDRTSGYRLSPAVRCDWTRFQQLAEHGLALGPDNGLDALEEALSLVRGRPFEGGDHAWAAPLLQEMLSRITDVAHTIATWRRTGPRKDLDAARRAIATGLDADDTAELLYQDWMRTEDAADNRAGVLRAVETVQAINRRLDVGMEPETEAVIQQILGGGTRAQSTGRAMEAATS